MKRISETVGKVMATVLPKLTSPITNQEPMKSSDVEKNEKKQSRAAKLRAFPEFGTFWQQRTFKELRVTHSEVQIAANSIQHFAKRYMQNSKPAERLVLCGPTGTGKTTMADGFFRWCFKTASSLDDTWSIFPQAAWCDWQKVCAQLNGAKADMTKIIEDVTDGAAIVFVDDIGAESDRYKSGVNLDALSYLLNRTHGNTWLVLTTNYGPGEWQEKFGARIEDRLLRESTVCHLEHVPSWSKL